MTVKGFINAGFVVGTKQKLLINTKYGKLL